MLVAGVDEAGRGCVIGPLVIAGVLIKEEKLPVLKRLGVKDSKLLSAKKRQALAIEIAGIAEKQVIMKLAPVEIDRAVESNRRLHKLNRLEAQTMAKVIEALKPAVAFVDAADVLEERFKNHIKEGLSFNAKIIAEHKADKTYPVVSAASIIAKVERDREIASLRGRYGEFGSGYLADSRTTRFMRQWLQAHGEYPDCVRKSWKPAKQLKDELNGLQKKLT